MNIAAWIKACSVYADKRMLFIFLNGIAQGFPWVVIGSAMTLWLKSEGFSRTAIGVFGSIFIAYSLNFLWAPLLDSVKLPLLNRLGQRRSWLLLTQILISIFIFLLAFTNPDKSFVWLSLFAFLVAISSATQDVAIDAYRIDILNQNEQDKLPATSALVTAGWWTGYSGLGAGILFLSTYMSWSQVYLIMSAMMGIFMVITLLMPSPPAHDEVLIDTQKISLMRWQERFSQWLLRALIEPFKDFFIRYGWAAASIFLFIFLFKIGEAFLGRMSLVFYQEVGFTTVEIATYSKLFGWWVTIIFAVIASIINVRYGLIKGLFISGIAMALTNLLFAYIALIGPDVKWFAVAILLDNFTSAFSTVAFVAFISHLTNRVYSATQYALMASIANFGRTTLAGGSGWLVDMLHGNWALFFTITALMVLPSLIVLRLGLTKIRAILK